MTEIEVGMEEVLSLDRDEGAKNLAGRYRLIAELGQGGMATVYLAVSVGTPGFRKLAVVKLLRPEIAVDQEFVQMFLDEARLCARLSHPNIVQTYDVGVDEVGHLMAMEYLDGVSLHAAASKLGKTGGPLTFSMQARVLLDVLEGLRYAHELKDYDGRSLDIVHRDVTPHNIFVTFDGQVKLLDFGIAKAATSSVKTATGVIKGKLTYMAPEQARGVKGPDHGMEPAVGSSPAPRGAGTVLMTGAREPEVAPLGGEVAREESRDAAFASPSSRTEAGPQGNWSTRTPGSSSAPRRADVHAGSRMADDSPATLPSSAPGSSSAPAGSALLSPGRPKVQLERDNPWR